jgi:hypothetical protein
MPLLILPSAELALLYDFLILHGVFGMNVYCEKEKECTDYTFPYCGSPDGHKHGCFKKNTLDGHAECQATLEQLLKMECDTVSITGQDLVVVPDFRVAVQRKTDAGVYIIIHADGFDSVTLDFLVKGNELKPV